MSDDNKTIRQSYCPATAQTRNRRPVRCPVGAVLVSLAAATPNGRTIAHSDFTDEDVRRVAAVIGIEDWGGQLARGVMEPILAVVLPE